MSPETPELRTLDFHQVTALVEWAAREGWNPGLHDAGAFWGADPEGFLGAFVGGEMVAGISAVAYGQRYGFIGLYICRPDMRGRGVGRAVWNAGMARLENRTIGLDGVTQQQGNYAAKGFAKRYRTFRMSGRFAGEPTDDPAIRPMAPELRRTVDAYDLTCFPAPRAAFVGRWLDAPRLALVVVRDETLAGYGVIRQCRQGCKIGPLFADTDDDARLLFTALAGCARGQPVHIDVPEPRGSFLEFLHAGGLQPGFETARMYRGELLPLSPRVYGVTTLELG